MRKRREACPSVLGDRGVGPCPLHPHEYSPPPETRPPPVRRSVGQGSKLTVGLCVLQQPKPGEPLYAQVNLEKKKKRQYELGVGQGQGQGPVGPGIGAGVGAPTAGQWVADGVGVPDGSAATSTVNVPPNSNAASAGDSWV